MHYVRYTFIRCYNSLMWCCSITTLHRNGSSSLRCYVNPSHRQPPVQVGDITQGDWLTKFTWTTTY